MAINPRTASVYVVDCSVSMGNLRTFVEERGEYERTRQVTGLEVVVQYVKAKIAQRIIRELKTTPIAVLTYAVPKTKNIVTTNMRLRSEAENVEYDKETDPYRGYYEKIPLNFTPNALMLETMDEVVAGEGLDSTASKAGAADALSAITVAIEMLNAEGKVKNYATKEIILLTDGESFTDWDGGAWKGVENILRAKGISLKVIGLDFEEEDVPYNGPEKSEIRQTNENNFGLLTSALEDPNSWVVSATAALSAIAEPTLREVNSAAIHTTLTIGDIVDHPSRSLLMYIEVKKAVTCALPKSMKSLSLTGFSKDRKTMGGPSQMGASNYTATQTQTQSGGQTLSQASTIANSNNGTQGGTGATQRFNMGSIGLTYEKYLLSEGLSLRNEEDADLQTHGVIRNITQYYRELDTPLSNTDLTTPEDEDREFNERPVDPDKELATGYYYGGSLVTTSELLEGTGLLKGESTGMQLIGFMKASKVRYDWRMGDLLYVYGSPGQIGSQKLLASFVRGMVEAKAVAIVRWVGKGMNIKGVFKVPDPKIGLLVPDIDTAGVDYCYWSQMPFAEDLRNVVFPSLEEVYNSKGQLLKEHKLLPTEKQNEAMSAFVDSMDLMEAGPVDDDGNRAPFFDVAESFSPSIHNIQNTLVFRLSSDSDLPPVSKFLTKYVDPPAVVLEASKEARKTLKEVFDVKPVPPKPKKITKKTTTNYNPEDSTTDHLEISLAFGGSKLSQTQTSLPPSYYKEGYERSLQDPQPTPYPGKGKGNDRMDIDEKESKPLGEAVKETGTLENMDVEEEEYDTEPEDED